MQEPGDLKPCPSALLNALDGVGIWPHLLPLTRSLDCSSEFPIAASAAWIPFPELPSRTQELPGKSVEIQVADTGLEAGLAVEWLIGHGRKAKLCAFVPGATPSRMWTPNPWLEQILPEKFPATALDLGCGSGRDSVALASAGWNVTAIDRLPDALARAQCLDARYRTKGPPIQWECAELGMEIPVKGGFDLVIMLAFLEKALLPKLHYVLSPGGLVAIETLTETHREATRKPKSDERILQTAEINTLLSGLEIVSVVEGWRDDRHSRRVLARRS